MGNRIILVAGYVDYRERLVADWNQGLLPQPLDLQITASVTSPYLQGLWRMALVNYERPEFERQVDAFLAGVSLKQRSARRSRAKRT